MLWVKTVESKFVNVSQIIAMAAEPTGVFASVAGGEVCLCKCEDKEHAERALQMLVATTSFGSKERANEHCFFTAAQPVADDALNPDEDTQVLLEFMRFPKGAMWEDPPADLDDVSPWDPPTVERR